jgi:hypothetical protein
MMTKNDWQQAIDARPMVVLGMSEYQQLLTEVARCAQTYEPVESIEDLVAGLGPGVEPEPEPEVRKLNPSSPLLAEDVDFLLDALEVRLALHDAPDYAALEDDGLEFIGIVDEDNPLAELLP